MESAVSRAFSVSAAARERPDAIAVVTASEEISWCELASRVEMARSELDAASPNWRSGRIGLLGRRDLRSLLRLYLLLEDSVPFFALHPRWTQSELAQLCSQFGVDSVWRDQQAAPLSRARAPVPGLTTQAMAVLFTSGTTGQPKGAVLSRRAMLAAANASARNLGWQEHDRWLLSLPIAHVGGLSIVTRCLAARSAVVLSEEQPFDPAVLMEQVERLQVTLLSLVPTMLKRVLDCCDEHAIAPPACLRAVLLGGAAASRSLVERAVDRGWPVLTTYGLTEACSQVATQEYSTRYEVQSGVGPVVEELEVKIQAAPGETPEQAGRILLRGESLFDGYLGLPSPFDRDGFFDTGDSGFLDPSGRLHIVGRRSDLIVTGGENVYPVEIETVLESHPRIASAAVFGLEDEEWGECVSAALVAVDAPLSDDELRQFLKQRLAGFKRPRRVCWLDQLPVNRSHKVDRSRAAAAASQRSRDLW